jgi:hypothetical protein
LDRSHPFFCGSTSGQISPRRKTPPTLPEKAHYSISSVFKTSIWQRLPGGTHVEGWELGSTLVKYLGKRCDFALSIVMVETTS